MLAGRGKIDAAAARNERLRRQARRRRQLYGERPVIAAGSTGSIPATAALLGAIADTAARRSRAARARHQPQRRAARARCSRTATRRAIRNMASRNCCAGSAPAIAEVEELAGDAARTQLVRAALAPADETAFWPERAGETRYRGGAGGGERARRAQCRSRGAGASRWRRAQALVEQQDVGIVCARPDAGAAHRGRAGAARYRMSTIRLERRSIQSPAGRLARQLLAVAAGGLCAGRHHRAAAQPRGALGLERGEVRAADRPAGPETARRAAAAGARRAARARRQRRAARFARPAGAGAGAAQRRSAIARETDARGALRTRSAPASKPSAPATICRGSTEFRHWAAELAGLDMAGAGFPPVRSRRRCSRR